MTGFELRTSGVGCNRSTNWATTTANSLFFHSSFCISLSLSLSCSFNLFLSLFLSLSTFLFLYLSPSILLSFSLSLSLSLSLILTSKHVHRLNRHQTSLLQFCLENVFLLLRDDADLSKSLSAVNNILSISIFNPFFLYRSRSYFKPLMIMHSTLVFSAMSWRHKQFSEQCNFSNLWPI